jgi:hypothetical protein
MKHTCAGLALAAFPGIVSTFLLAEVTPVPEPLSTIAALAASAQAYNEA